MATKAQATSSAKKAPAKKIATSRQKYVVSGTSKEVPLRALRERFGVNRKSFARMLGFSERALADWESGKPPSEAGLQRIREMTRLQKALAGVMRAEFIGTWLNAPNPGFRSLKPIEVIERGEIDRLWRMIYQLESGMPT